MNLTFNESAHRYELDGRAVPSVTTVIGGCVPNEFAHLPDCYKERGTVVHAAVAAALNGQKFKWIGEARAFKPRADACLKFAKAAKLTPVAVERRLASERLRYAGTIDLVANDGGETLVVVDWKGTVTKSVDVQLGAYAILWNECNSNVVCRANKAVAVEYGDDGGYKCRWLTAAELRAAGQVFLAMLTVWSWRERNGYNKPKV